MMSTVQKKLPHWKVDKIYSGLDGKDYAKAVKELQQRIDALAVWFNDCGIRRLDSPPSQSIQDLATTLQETLVRLNETAIRYGTLDSYIYAFVSTNSYDAEAARETSKLEILGTERQKLDVRFQAWVGSLTNI